MDQNNAVVRADAPRTEVTESRGPTAVMPSSDLPGWFAGPSQVGVLTSLDLSDPTDIFLFVQARQEKVTALMDVINRTIEVSDYVAHPITLQEEGGELKDLVRIVLISPTGEMYQASSEGVRMSLTLIFQCRGKGPWEPPVRLTPKLTKTRRGHNILQLMMERPDVTVPTVAPPRKVGGRVAAQTRPAGSEPPPGAPQ